MAANARGEVTRHGKFCTSVFDLLGHQENEVTAALGFTLAQSPRLLTAIMRRLLPDAEAARAAVRLETSASSGLRKSFRTDFDRAAAVALARVQSRDEEEAA